jgi:hypothetical protein
MGTAVVAENASLYDAKFNGVAPLQAPHHVHALGFQSRDAHSRRSGSLKQGNRKMTKNFALAASIAMLVTISGQALAETAAPNARYEPEAASTAGWRAVNAFDRTAATGTAEPDAYHYHGGPKVND